MDTYFEGLLLPPSVARQFRIPFFQCLGAQAWDLVLTSSYSGWQLSLRPYIVGRSCDIFDYAERGDIPRMMELFQKGEASPYDHHPVSGYNLLHVSYCPPEPVFEQRRTTNAAFSVLLILNVLHLTLSLVSVRPHDPLCPFESPLDRHSL